MKHTIEAIAQRNWPLATRRAARKQAFRLIRAKQYLNHRGINAVAINSEFKYQSAPQVLA